jgi:hypothetical protein
MARPNRSWDSNATQRIAWLAACVLACAAAGCTRSRDANDGGAAHGGSEAGKDGGASTGGGESGVPGASGGKGGQGPAGAGAGAGGAPGSVTPVEGGYCCTPSPKPNCCMIYGGFTTSKQGCGEACDGMPMPGEAWTLGTDEHGCKQWVEPREWTDCCGCVPHTRVCSPDGTWQITYEKTATDCAPLTDTFTLSSDDDAGTAEVVFQNRGQSSSSCAGEGGFGETPSYEATATVSENGCVVTLASHSKWCSHGENQCDELDLKLYLNPFEAGAEVEGTSHKCWCGSSGPEGTKVDLRGTAQRAN